MNKDKRSKSKESITRNKQDDNSGRQLKSVGQSEGSESWSNAESSVGSSARKRPSSWDDSDDDSPRTNTNPLNQNDLVYSARSPKQETSVADEINDIKIQYFKNLDALGLSETRNFNLEARAYKIDEIRGEARTKLDGSDRRQSPARIRRRTKSSSSCSAVLEPTVECSSSEYREEFHILTPESYQYKVPRHQSYSSENSSLKVELEIDSNYFLDHLFTELRTKRIGLVRLGEESSFGKGNRGGNLLDLESCPEANVKLLKPQDLVRSFPSPTYSPDLKTLESLESDGPITFIHKTSRKLSQILEVEETKKSLEGVDLVEEESDVRLFEMSPFLWANPEKPPEGMTSPYPTSNDGEENMRFWTSIITLRENSESLSPEIAQLSAKNSDSLEEVKEEEDPENHHTKENLSERFYNLFPSNDNDSDSIIFLTEKAGQTQLGSNSEKQESKICDSPKDLETDQLLDGTEGEANWEILEMENVNSERDNVDVGENPGSRGTNSDSGTRQEGLSHIKTPNSEAGRNCQEERVPNLSEEALASCSEGSTPRRSGHQTSRKSSKREGEADFRLEMESLNLSSQRLTSRSLKIEEEEVTPVHSSRESSFRLRSEYPKSTSRDMSKESSHRTCDNLNPETVEDRPNFLKIDLEKVCSGRYSSTTDSNSSSSRTSTKEEVKDSTFRTNSSRQSAKSSHTSAPAKTPGSNKTKKDFSDSSDPNRLTMKGNQTDRHSKSRGLSSRSLKNSVFGGNVERETESCVSDALRVWEKETSAGNSERRSTTPGKRKPETRPVSRNSSANSCSSATSEVRLAQLKDNNPESTAAFKKTENYRFYDDVTTTVGKFTSEKISSSRSEKTGKKWRRDESTRRNEEEGKKGVCVARSEEIIRDENLNRNLLSVQIKDTKQEDIESCKKDGETIRDIVIDEQLSEDITTIEESEKVVSDKGSLSPTSAKTVNNELTIPVEDNSYSLEKIEIDSDKSGRETERAETGGNRERNTPGRTGRLSNESLSIAFEKVKISSGQTSNRTAISSVSSEIADKHTSNISQPGSCRYTTTEESQLLDERPKSTKSKTSVREASTESLTSKAIFQDRVNGETWNRLIDAFEGSQRSKSSSSENKFPGFPSLNQKGFAEHQGQETQDFFLYQPDDLNEPEDIFTLSRRLVEEEGKSWLLSPKDREQKEDLCEALVPESITLPLEYAEGGWGFKSNDGKSAREDDSKRRNFEIGEFGDGNCWHDGKPDISEPEKPQNHGDGNQERRNNWESLVSSLEDNKADIEMKSKGQTWMELVSEDPRPNLPKNKSFSAKENNANWEPIFNSHNLNHSKSENSLSKIWCQQREKESENLKMATDSGSTKGKSSRESVSSSTTGNCSEESFDDYQLGRSYSSDECRLACGKTPRQEFEVLYTVSSEAENRKQEKETTNLNIFLAGQKKESDLVKANSWLIIKNQEGKASKQQKEKIRKLKERLKKSGKLNSAKEPLFSDENATGKMPAFVPVLKFGNTGCLQNFYKRLISICCVTSNSSAATSV